MDEFFHPAFLFARMQFRKPAQLTEDIYQSLPAARRTSGTPPAGEKLCLQRATGS